MICYQKEDITDLKNYEGQYCMPNALFDTMQYKLVRLGSEMGICGMLKCDVKESII